MTPRKGGGGTTSMTAQEVKTRAEHARGHLRAAELVATFDDDFDSSAVANVIAALAVLSGIAAGDAICGHELGVRSNSGNHADAVKLLATSATGSKAASHLSDLIAIKGEAHYSPANITTARGNDAVKHATRLLDSMEKSLRGRLS